VPIVVGGDCLHGDNDTTGALRAVESITTGLRWRRAQEPVIVLGTPGQADLDACWELGTALAASLVLDLKKRRGASKSVPRALKANHAITGCAPAGPGAQ
jgi:hypothetical protein